MVVATTSKRTITIPDFVPEDAVTIYFTGLDMADLQRRVSEWLLGADPRKCPLDTECATLRETADASD